MEVKAKELDCILPGESMLEILSRLPVKSLMKFACVKKSWYNLVKDPRFIQLHSDHSSNAENDTFIKVTWNKPFWREGSSKFSVICPGSSCLDRNIGLAESGKVAIVGSANGLVCLTYFGHRFGSKFKVVNPALRQQQDVCKIGPYSSSMTIGFGFDKKNGDYKILRIACVYSDRQRANIPVIKLYSLRSHSWKTIQNPTASWMIKFSQSCMVTTESGLHFMSFDKLRKILVSFDLSTEKFVYYAAPQYGCYEQILAWKNKSLAVIVPDPINIFRGCYKVLVLNNGNWEVGMKLSLDGLPGTLFETSTRNHNEFPIFCEHDKSNYLLYLSKKTKKKNVSPSVKFIMNTHICPYRESLVPLVMPPSLRVFKTKASKNLNKEAGKAYEEVHYVMSVP